MNKRLIERIGMGGVIAAFVSYFCYQVAYVMPMVIGPNGTMNFSGNGTSAQFSAPPGTVIRNPSIQIENSSMPAKPSLFLNISKTVDFNIGKWTMFNTTSGSISKIFFNKNTGYFTRTLHGHHIKGLFRMDYTRPPEEVLELCPNQPYTIFPHDCVNYFIDFKNANHVRAP